MAEKYDGIMGQWMQPDKPPLCSRNGKAIKAPKWWLNRMPSVPCIGELWLGYGTTCIEATQLLRSDDQWQWRDVRLMVFACDDWMRLECNNRTEPVLWQTVKNRRHIMRAYDEVIQRGGEGLVIRSGLGLTKLKPSLDAEGIVCGFTEGRNKGEIGGIIVHVSNGPAKGLRVILSAGIPEAKRRREAMPEGLVRFSCVGYHKSGQPREAVYRGPRDAATMKP